ncbi:MAG: FAD-dependent oxidoreductase, partial [Pseudomonadota bacterium]
AAGETDQLLCLINAPAFGDAKRLSKEELAPWEEATFSLLARCGLTVERTSQNTHITQPADFEALFPGSGGALYGRASHGWLASFSRPGARTKLKNFYLAGGSVHPGAGVPMATLSGQLAAQQMMQDHGSI